MLDRLLGLASAASFAIGAMAGPSGPPATVELTYDDPGIVESSGLVATGDHFLTVNDSGDGGRVFVVDRSGATVGTTSWGPEPFDIESLAPAGPGEVWVGDTGDNRRVRDSISVLRVPYGATDQEVTPASYELFYPDRAHDAETLMADPTTGRLYVYSKDVFGGTLYAAPRKLSADGPNPLTAVTDGFAFATDGAFFPDGRHYVVRGYTSAAVYTFPGHERIGSFPLPQQEQGEGIAVGADGALYLGTEGQFSDVLRMRVPRDVARAMKPSPAPSPSAAPEAAGPAVDPADDEDPLWPWVLGSGLAFAVGAGWLLRRRGQAP